MQNIVFLDTETGGFDASQHSLLSIAMVVTDTRYCEIRRFETFIRHPRFVVTPEAMAKNRIDLSQSTAWPTVDEAKRAIVTFLDKPLSVLNGVPDERNLWLIHGKNTGFDVRMLQAFFGEDVFRSLFWYFSRDIAETFLTLAEMGIVQMSTRGLSLHDICNALRIEHDPSYLHDALYDTLMTLECMKVMKEKMRRVGLLIDANRRPRPIAGAAPGA